jgi:large subunit ribosomal protein L5
MAARLQDAYRTKIAAEMAKKHGRSNPMAVPKIQKVVVSMGFGRASTAGEKQKIDEIVRQLGQITGQKPLVTQARQSVSGFKLREGMKVGAKVTLRGARMYEFLDRLINVALPRVRDFRGLNQRGFDGAGNYNMGLTEQTIFPEVEMDKMQFTQGLNIAIVIDNATDDESLDMLKMFGMPFRN